MDLYNLIPDSWKPYVALATALVTAASLALAAVAKLTDTTKDDTVAAWVRKALSWFSLNVSLPQPTDEE